MLCSHSSKSRTTHSFVPQLVQTGFSHTRMTYSLERVHFISIYLSVCVNMIPKRLFVSVQVIPEFIPNETVVMVQDFILVSCKLRSNFVPDWLCFWSGPKTPRLGTPLTESFDFIMWMRYKHHSGTKLISEWKSFRYHINTLSVKTNLLDKGL